MKGWAVLEDLGIIPRPTFDILLVPAISDLHGTWLEDISARLKRYFCAIEQVASLVGVRA